MNEQTLYVVVKLTVKPKTDLSVEAIIDEIGQESDYDFPSTDNVEVIESEWLDTSTQCPEF